MQRHFLRTWIGVALGSSALGMASGTLADVSGSNKAAAQALFDQAKQLLAHGKADEACLKFEESQRLDPASGTLINLADCYEQQGKFATAWSTFLGAATAAKTSGNAERERVARERATALGQHLSHIVIQVASDGTPGLEVQRDGARIGKAQWGTPIPADPGPHRVLASAPGRKVWETIVTLRREPETQTVSVPELEPAAPVQQQGRAPSDETGGLGTQRTGALVAGGVGIAGLVVGSVFGLVSKSKHDEASQFCDGSTCSTERGVDLRSEALVAGNISTVAFITGAAGLAAGAALWVTAAPDVPRGTTAQLGIGPGSLVLRGTW
ncbi:MAG TPA: hypothetical protein VF881_00155 [Polyangiaceae bacterium]